MGTRLLFGLVGQGPGGRLHSRQADLYAITGSPAADHASLVTIAALVPEATHIVKYQRKDTGTRELEGRVACKLAAVNHGRDEWWLLLEPIAS